MFFGVTGRHLMGFGILLALASAMLACASKTSESRSLDSALCAAGEERLAFSNLIFCWPTGADAPDYKFEVPETMVGAQDIDGRHVIFSIFPVDSSMFRAFRDEIAHKERIGRAVELRIGDADVFTIESNEGKGYGRHAFEFRKVGSKYFVASKILTAEGWPEQQVEYWAAMTDEGEVDYVMRCGGLGIKPNCYSQFLLFDNLVRIGILSVENTDDALGAFEVLRSRIRSYVASPNPAP